MKKTKAAYHQQKIKDSNPKELFREVKQLISGPSKPVLPCHSDPGPLAEAFSEFVHDKIATIRKSLDQLQCGELVIDSDDECQSSFSNFNAVTDASILELIKKAPMKTSCLDPLPASVFKRCVSDLVQVFSRIVNLSLVSGRVPDDFKYAAVTPLLKKSTFDREEKKNYRPVSNLSYVSKLLERVVASQLHTYLRQHHLYEPMQSAYHPE